MSTVDPGAGVSAPEVSPSSAGAPAVPASPAEGSSPASPAGSPESPGIRQLREQYEATKRELEPWKNLNAKPEELQRSHQTLQKISTEATQLGQKLGYDPQEVLDALATDPIQTITVLRQMAQQAQQTEKPLTRAEAEKIADARAKELLKPFQQEREQALDTKAEQVFDGEIDRQLKTSFPNGLPDSNVEALRGLAWQLLIDNKDGYNALRGKGDPAAIAAAYEQAKKTLLKIVADYGEHEKTRIGTPPTERKPQATTKAASIDDIISNLGNQSVPMTEVFSRR